MPAFLRDPRIYPMIGAMLALFLAAIDQTIVATALPEIVRELNGLQHLSWVVTAYMLASTVTVPLVGKLSDIYGRRSFFLLGIIVFLIGSVLSGISWSMLSLVLFRALQGIGAGAIMVNAFAVVGDLFAPAERGKWQGLIGAVFGLSSIAGPLLGGLLTDAASWRWVFYVNIPIGLLALGVIANTLSHRAKREERLPIDVVGALFLATTIAPLLLALVWGGTEYAWDSTVILGLFVASIVSLGAFIWTERHAADPVLPLWLFSHRAFSVSVMVMFLIMIGMFGSILFIPLYAQGVIGFDATAAGLVLTPMSLAIVFSSAIVGQIVSRTGKYKLISVCGIGAVTLAMYSFVSLSADTTQLALIFRMIFMGLGLGVAMPVFNLVVQSAFEQRYLGVVTSSLQVARSIGGAFGAALLGGFLNTALSSRLAALPREPFLDYLPQDSVLNMQVIENFLTPQGREAAQGMIAHLPSESLPSAQAALAHFVSTVRVAFAGALSETYLVATATLGLAFVIVLFLPEISLRRGPMRPALEETGVELEEEFGVSDPAHEPRL